MELEVDYTRMTALSGELRDFLSLSDVTIGEGVLVALMLAGRLISEDKLKDKEMQVWIQSTLDYIELNWTEGLPIC